MIGLGALASSCRKESMIDANGNNTNPTFPTNRAISSIQYDATHDVLMFPSHEAMQQAADEIIQRMNDFEYDKGNNASIMSTLTAMKTQGYNTQQGSPLNINTFKTLLLNSYPLSHEVKREILSTNATMRFPFPEQFMLDVLIPNVPFHKSVYDGISQSSLSSNSKTQILAADDNLTLDKNYIFDEFLASYPAFNSLWKARRAEKKSLLESGFDPGETWLRITKGDLLSTDLEQLFMNDKYEVYIEGVLYKMYKDCKMATIHGEINNAYGELAMLNSNGGVATPQNLAETDAGLPIETMNNNFPMDYATVDPEVFDPSQVALQNFNQAPAGSCPKSAFTYICTYIDDDFYVQFENLSENTYTGQFYHYWTFGDGTGSFQENPSHKYTQTGSYTITLTTFNESCGCWDVQKQIIVIHNMGKPPVFCDASFNYSPDSPGSLTYHFNVSNTSYCSWGTVTYTDYDATWDFGDGSPTETGQYVTHTFTELDNTPVSLTLLFKDEYGNPVCSDTRTVELNSPSSTVDCHRKDKEKFKYELVFGGNYSMTMTGKYRGTWWGFGGARIKAQTEFFKKKSNGNWKREQADEISTLYDGNIFNVSSEGECLGTATPVDDSKVKDNESGVLLWSPMLNGGNGYGFGVEDGGMNTGHQVIFNGLTSPLFIINL